MQGDLRNINTRIEFSNYIPPVTNTTKMRNTMHGQLIVGSLLSFDLNPIEHTSKIKSNIVSLEKPLCTEHEYQALSRFFIDEKLAIVPKNGQLNSSGKKLSELCKCYKWKIYLAGTRQDTDGITVKKKWLFCKKGKIENYRAYRILRLRNFRSLANEILFSKKGLPQSKKTWSIKNIFWYYNIVCLYLNRHVQLREVEFVFQPHLPWIVATLDGLRNDPIGILRIE